MVCLRCVHQAPRQKAQSQRAQSAALRPALRDRAPATAFFAATTAFCTAFLAALREAATVAPASLAAVPAFQLAACVAAPSFWFVRFTPARHADHRPQPRDACCSSADRSAGSHAGRPASTSASSPAPILADSDDGGDCPLRSLGVPPARRPTRQSQCISNRVIKPCSFGQQQSCSQNKSRITLESLA